MPDLQSELQRIAPRVVEAPKPEDLPPRPPAPPRHPPAMRPRPVDLTTQVRELTMADGRRLMADRRGITFVVEGEPDAEGRRPTIIAWRTLAKPVPVRQSYGDITQWWLGSKGRPRP